jgi:hypothetical protein
MPISSHAHGDEQHRPHLSPDPLEGTLSTTSRDRSTLMLAFRELLDAAARRLLDERWPEIEAELAQVRASDDVVVLVSDRRDAWPPRRLPHMMTSVVPRATDVALTLVGDVRVSGWLAESTPDPRSVDVVVEIDGALSALRVERTRERTLPEIDVTRGFSLWNVRRGREARYVFLDAGDAVATWDALASMLGADVRALDEAIEQADDDARELLVDWITWARLGDAIVRCVRIELVEAFLREIEHAQADFEAETVRGVDVPTLPDAPPLEAAFPLTARR